MFIHDDYVSQIIETSQKLDRTGMKLDTSLVGSLLLAGLPERFAPMVMAIEHSGIEITTDVIKSKLLDMQEDGSTISTAKALISKNGNHRPHHRNDNRSRNDRYGNDKRQKEIICFKCKQPGHIMSKCPQNKSMQNNYDKSQDKQTRNAFNVAFLTAEYNKEDWFLDSGASIHLTCRQDWLLNSRNPQIQDIMVADNKRIMVKSSGDIDILTRTSEGSHEVQIKNVQYVPELATNLLSVSELLKKGNNVKFDNEKCRIFNTNNVLVAEAHLINGVYKLDLNKNCLLAGKAESGELWHKRLGHINSNYLNKMRDGIVHGINYKGDAKIYLENCEVCCEGKQHRFSFGNSN